MKKPRTFLYGVTLGTVLFVTNNGFSNIVEHISHYELHIPEQQNEREQKQAEQDSKENGISVYQDDRGNYHVYEHGSEIH